MKQMLAKSKKYREKIHERKELMRQFLKKIYLGELTPSRMANRLINGVKVFIASTRKFINDDCLTKASSISYTSIMSLIPTLFVVLTILSSFYGAEGKKEELFRTISFFMKDNGINITIDPVFAALSGLIDNAGKIGGISAVFMIFTATALLRSMEKSLNDIWKVTKTRPVFLRMIYYWAFLTLGPVMLIAGTTMATQLSYFFSSPNYNGATVSESGDLWVVGNKAGILRQMKNREPERVKDVQIDYDNQASFDYDEATGGFVESEHRIDEIQYERSDFFGIDFAENWGWIVGDRGLMLTTRDSGKTWSLGRWGSFNLRDIRMLDMMRGFCIGERGVLLKTDDGGVIWSRVNTPGITSDLNAVAFSGMRGFIAGDSGTMLSTADGGKTWSSEKLKAAEKNGRYINLNGLFMVNEYDIFLVGSEGVILNSRNGGATWKSQKFREYGYRAAHFFNAREGAVAGDRGILIVTKNGGDTWQKTSFPTFQVNRLLFAKSDLWAVGDMGLLMHSPDRGLHWRGREGRSFISLLINFLAPFVFIWILFLVVYISLPNTKVPFKHAAIGASFTGAVWVIFILLFIYYVKGFARGTFAVYGALAAIPLFLLIVYSSSLIILYGAELAYTLMHPESYLTLAHPVADGRRYQIYYGISLLYRIFERFETGGGASDFKDILGTVSNRTETVDYYIKLFTERGFITQVQGGGWAPLKSASVVTVEEIVDAITGEAYRIPPSHRRGAHLQGYLKGLFGTFTDMKKKVMGSTTLAEMIEHIKAKDQRI